MRKIICIDDVCPENLKYFWPVSQIKAKYNNSRIIAFVIANYHNEQNISESPEFNKWFEEYKNTVEIGLHGYDHTYPPEQEKSNAEELVYKSIQILKPYLKPRFLYRPPGHQRTIHTESILKKCGVSGIAYRNRIKYFDTNEIIEGLINLHCTNDKYENPIIKVYNKL